MVFSSIPAYFDPANWQQQPNQQTGDSSSGASTQFAPSPPPQPDGSGGAGSNRPGSMADRARMANIPVMPEAALKCPRCESANTKFCYFNNYSLTQPRHFCKTCRRYWTRGGALRNVPVGGGSKRNNKRSKGSSSSKSPANSTDRQTAASGSKSTRFITPLHHHLTNEFASAADIGLSNYGSFSASVVGGGENDLNFHIGNALANGGTGTGLDQWRLQQAHQLFPFMGGLDSSSSSSSGLYPFEGGVEASGQVLPKISNTGVSQLAAAAASLKIEESHHHHRHQHQQQQQQELNLSRQFLGIQGNDHQYWSTLSGTAAEAWTDLSSFSSSSTGNPL